MPIVEFENRRQTPLTVAVEPIGEKRLISHLSSVAIRYQVNEGEEDRSCTVVSENEIEFWCNADRCEVEVVDATKFDRLSWDMCVNGGWCGGIVDGKPTRVDDLIPESGTISAEDFAKLAMRADGWPESEPFEEKFIQHLKELFIKYFGVEPVDVEEFRHLPAVPFSR